MNRQDCALAWMHFQDVSDSVFELAFVSNLTLPEF